MSHASVCTSATLKTVLMAKVRKVSARFGEMGPVPAPAGVQRDHGLEQGDGAHARKDAADRGEAGLEG
jgi:hypothetical protein